ARTFFDRGRALGRLRLRTALAVALLAGAGAATPLFVRRASTLVPPPRSDAYASGPLGFPADCARNGPIYFAPIGQRCHPDDSAIARRYEEAYSVRVVVLPELVPPPSAFNEERHQLVSEEVLAAMASLYRDQLEDKAVIIGLTDRDMYIRGKSW